VAGGGGGQEDALSPKNLRVGEKTARFFPPRRGVEDDAGSGRVQSWVFYC